MERMQSCGAGVLAVLEPLEQRVLLTGSNIASEAPVGLEAVADARQRGRRNRPVLYKARYGSVPEGDAGESSVLRIVIKRTGVKALLGPGSVDFATIAAPTAIPAAVADFAATSGTVLFAPRSKRAFAEVTVFGNNQTQGHRHVAIQISNASGGTIKPGAEVGLGAILDDDGSSNPPNNPPKQPKVTVSDVTKAEGDTGTTTFAFNVTLDQASSQTVTVSYATANSTATTGDNDYKAVSGTLTFSPGQTSKTINVLVNGDTKVEPVEAFAVKLTSPVNATLAKATGTGTIQNDDTGFPQLEILSLTGLPDGVSISGSNPATTATIKVVIQNKGTAATPATKLRLLMRRVGTVLDLGQIDVPALAPGQKSGTLTKVVDLNQPGITTDQWPVYAQIDPKLGTDKDGQFIATADGEYFIADVSVSTTLGGSVKTTLPANVTLGQKVPATLAIKTTGPAYKTLDVSLYAEPVGGGNSVLLASTTVSNGGPGTSVNRSVTLDFGKQGLQAGKSYQIVADVSTGPDFFTDPVGTVAIAPAGVVDLTITQGNVVVDFAQQLYKVQLQVKNNGGAAASASQVRFELRFDDQSTVTLVVLGVPALAAGQSATVNYIVDPKPAFNLTDFPPLWAVLTLVDANFGNNAEFLDFVPTGENLTNPF
mgnify:CR=1 FL=1